MKVGEYCRTDKGKIGKIVHFEPRDKYPYSYDRVILDTEGYKRTTRNIIKCSEEIIDLIKKKDIIIDYKGNIYQVVKVWKGYVFTDKKNEYGQVITLVDYQIKSIVTKECFESMEYKVKE